jgi:hypothetical protein
MLEFKEGRRIQIEGNTFTNEWQDAQQGVPLVMTPMSDGIDYFVVTEDLNYTNNIVAHSLQLMGFAPICPIAPAH